MNENDILKTGLKVIEDEISALEIVKSKLGKSFINAVKLIYECKGKVVVTGMGKSGLIASKIAATLTSTGTPAFYLNPAEGIHGDIGILLKDDVLIALSKSGETDEIIKILPYIKRLNIPLITITSRPNSILAQQSDIVINMGVEDEACPLNLAPTSSSTAELVIGDAIAIALLKLRNFSEEDFALLHPGGLLSKKLLKVKDIMHKGDELPIVNENETMRKVIATIIEKKLGVAIIVNDDNKLTGIIVDGDLKRILMKTEHIMDKKAKEFMTKDPKTIDGDELVAKALKIMEGKITSLIIKNENNEPIGLLHIHDILKAGIY
jgi:arabinose-5-phosphate isomerase